MGAKTEKDIARAAIVKKFREVGADLCAQAVENVAANGQDASFSVTVKIEPSSEEGVDVKVATRGRITLSTAQQTDHFALSEQTTLDTEE